MKRNTLELPACKKPIPLKTHHKQICKLCAQLIAQQIAYILTEYDSEEHCSHCGGNSGSATVAIHGAVKS